MMPVRSYATIPSDDENFRRAVESVIDEVDDIERLRDLISTMYPNAHISVQGSLGSLPGQPTRVYIYRDGAVRPEEA